MAIRIPLGFSKYRSNKKCEKARFCPKCNIAVKEVKKVGNHYISTCEHCGRSWMTI